MLNQQFVSIRCGKFTGLWVCGAEDRIFVGCEHLHWVCVNDQSLISERSSLAAAESPDAANSAAYARRSETCLRVIWFSPDRGIACNPDPWEWWWAELQFRQSECRCAYGGSHRLGGDECSWPYRSALRWKQTGERLDRRVRWRKEWRSLVSVRLTP